MRSEDISPHARRRIRFVAVTVLADASENIRGGSNMLNPRSARGRWLVAALAALTAAFAFSASAAAERSLFFEETASAFWAVPHECADGSIVPGTLLVLTTRDFESPDTEDANPTARVQFQAVCPDGSSFGWIGFVPATIASTENLKSVVASGSGTVTDNLGGTHPVTFDVMWTGVGPLETTVNTAGSKRQQREATATGQVTFDGEVLVDGEADHPTRPAPFIRIDTEK
jgi:hypothetical protein